jgi:hypothetical protein
MSDFSEFNPPQLEELVAFEPYLRARFVPALNGKFFRFKGVRASPDLVEDEWLFYDELFDIDVRCTQPDRCAPYIRRATLSEKDAHIRQIDPATRQLNANLRQVFAATRRKK